MIASSLVVASLDAGKLAVSVACLDDEFGLRTGAAGMCGVGVTRELYGFLVVELERLLEPLADLEEHFLALLSSTGLAAVARNSATNRPRPETDTVEASSNVDDNAHDLVVLLVFEVLANGSKHDVQPERVDVDGLLVLELERPLASVLVLRIFPLGPYALLEEMVVGLERKVRGRGDVVLHTRLVQDCIREPHKTYVDAPELLD